jgi:anti-sigma factor RsiW
MAKVKHNGKWIKTAIKRPGALHRALHVPEDEKIPAKKMAKARKQAKKNPGSKLAKMVNLARTLGKMHKK